MAKETPQTPAPATPPTPPAGETPAPPEPKETFTFSVSVTEFGTKVSDMKANCGGAVLEAGMALYRKLNRKQKS